MKSLMAVIIVGDLLISRISQQSIFKIPLQGLSTRISKTNSQFIDIDLQLTTLKSDFRYQLLRNISITTNTSQRRKEI